MGVGPDDTAARLRLLFEDLASRGLKASGRTIETWSKKGRAHLSRFNASAGRTLTVLGAMATAMAILAAKKGLDYINSLGEIAEATDNLARATGLAHERIQELRHIEEQTATETDTLAKAYVELQKRMYDAVVNESADAIRAFERMGVHVDELAGKDGKLVDAGPIWDRFADHVRNAGVESARTAEAGYVIGQGLAEKVIPALDIGAAAFARLTQEAHDLGRVTGVETIMKLRELRDTQDRITKAIESSARAIAVELIPDILDLAHHLEAFARDGSGDVKAMADDIRYYMGIVTQSFGYALFAARDFTDTLNLAAKAPTVWGAKLIQVFGGGKFERLLFPELPKWKKELKEAEAARQKIYDFFFGPKRRRTGAAEDDEEAGLLAGFESEPGADATATPALDARHQAILDKTRAFEEQRELQQLEAAARLLEQTNLAGMTDLEALDARHQATLERWQGHHDLVEALERRHAGTRLAIQQRMAIAEKSANVTLLGSIQSALQAFGVRNIALQKVLGVSQAVIAMNVGVAKALLHPWPLSAKLAASARIQGMAAIAGILAVTPGGGGGGSAPAISSVSGGGRYSPSITPAPIPQTDARHLTIQIVGPVTDDWSTVTREKIVPEIKGAFGDNYDFGGLTVQAT